MPKSYAGFSFLGVKSMNRIREGDLYHTITLGDIQFEIRYGYTCENERELWGPSPIYPDFIKTPVISKEGLPFVTAFQDICPHYEAHQNPSGEQWCCDCIYFKKIEKEFGLCRCEKNRRNNHE